MAYAKKYQRENTRNLLLEILKAGGEVTLMLTAPGATPYFMRPYMKGEHLDEKKFRDNIYRLQRSELISVASEGDEVTLALTEKGENKAIKMSFCDMKLKKPEKWDKKWRIVMFDVPDNRKTARNVFKATLDQLGFVTIQKSVYAHPYPCEDEIEIIRSVYEIRPFVQILTADSFEGDHKYLNRFGLSR